MVMVREGLINDVRGQIWSDCDNILKTSFACRAQW